MIFGGAFRYLSEWSNVMTEVPGQLAKHVLYLFCYDHFSFIIFKAVTWYRNLCQLDVSVTPDLLFYHHIHCNCHCHHWIYNITAMVLQIWEKLESRLKFSFFLSLFWPFLNIFCKNLKRKVHSPTKNCVRFQSFSYVCFTYIMYRMTTGNSDTHTNICININTDEFWNSKTLISTQKKLSHIHMYCDHTTQSWVIYSL